MKIPVAAVSSEAAETIPVCGSSCFSSSAADAATDADALADAIPEEEIAVTAVTETVTVTGMMAVDAATGIVTETETATEIVTETGIVTVTEIGMTGVGAEMTDARNPDPLSLIPVLPAGVRIHASKIVK